MVSFAIYWGKNPHDDNPAIITPNNNKLYFLPAQRAMQSAFTRFLPARCRESK